MQIVAKQYKVDNRFYIDIVYTFVQGGVPSDQRTSDLENPLQILWYAGIYPLLQGYRHSSFADSLFAPHEAQVTGGPWGTSFPQRPQWNVQSVDFPAW